MTWSTQSANLKVKPNQTMLYCLSQVQHISAWLRQYYPNLGLNLLQAKVDNCSLAEQKQLGLDTSKAYVRRVLIGTDSVPCIYARAILPLPTYYAYQKDFDTLGNQFLGQSILYKNQANQRSCFEFSYGIPDDNYLTKPAFARRSIFTMGQHRLLLSEWFLDGFAQCEVCNQ